MKKKEKSHIQLRTVFMGTSALAEDALETLIAQEYNIVGVYTKPDAKVGRDQKEQATPVKEIAEKNKIPVFTPKKFDTEAIDSLKKLKPDIIVVASYGKILPKEVLSIPGFGCINIHTSLLPKFRGPSPIQNALLAGETQTGVTIMLMDEGIDTGDILAQESLDIDPNDTYESLYNKLSKLGGNLLEKTLPLWIERKIQPKQQESEKATLCQLIDREDGRIFWSEEADMIYNRYRALYPWPGIFTFWKNDGGINRIKLLSVSLHPGNTVSHHELGEVFQLGEKIGVQALNGVIIIERLQPEGKKAMSTSEFINGYKNFIGSVLQ